MKVASCFLNPLYCFPHLESYCGQDFQNMNRTDRQNCKRCFLIIMFGPFFFSVMFIQSHSPVLQQRIISPLREGSSVSSTCGAHRLPFQLVSGINVTYFKFVTFIPAPRCIYSLTHKNFGRAHWKQYLFIKKILRSVA